jgi:hypothetical protein
MEKDHWLPLDATSFGALGKPANLNCDPQTAAAMATLLFGCYRASEANDPETFMAAAAATLSRYPTHVVIDVCDPIRGLPSGDEWLPSIARIRTACEEKMKPIYEAQRREQIRGDTLRGRTTGKPPVGSPEHQRVTQMFKVLRESLWPADGSVGAAVLDARTAPTPELRAKAVAYHEARLAELANAYAAADQDARAQQMCGGEDMCSGEDDMRSSTSGL